jgi:hypothetical protein
MVCRVGKAEDAHVAAEFSFVQAWCAAWERQKMRMFAAEFSCAQAWCATWESQKTGRAS